MVKVVGITTNNLAVLILRMCTTHYTSTTVMRDGSRYHNLAVLSLRMCTYTCVVKVIGNCYLSLVTKDIVV